MRIVLVVVDYRFFGNLVFSLVRKGVFGEGVNYRLVVLVGIDLIW